MKRKRIMSAFLSLIMSASIAPQAALAEGSEYPEGTVIIALDESGKPASASGTGWEYDSASSTLSLQKGYSFAVDGECGVTVTNLGTIVGGTYNGTVNNTGSTSVMNEQGGVIDNGTFNGEVNNFHSYNTCTINNGTFNGKVTIGNHCIINGGTFLGDFDSKKIGWKINSATFRIEFEKNGGSWAEGYTAPATYSYSTSAGTALPTADNISKDDSVFYGWYSDAEFSGEPVTKIPAKANGKLTYYARYIASDATWALIGEQAAENTDYAVDDDGNYSIFTAKGLAKLANVVNGGDTLLGKTVTLERDIDLRDGGVAGYNASDVNNLNSWIPIDGFSGTFDGNGKKISYLYISTKNKDAGLFGSNYGTIKNLKIDHGFVKVTSSLSSVVCVGAIAASNVGIIEDCVNLISIQTEGAIYAGGITGKTSTAYQNVRVSDCKNYGDISSEKGNSYLGGIVGYQFSGYISNYTVTVENCINEGEISGKWYLGGISGTVKNNSASTSSLVRNCFNKGDVNGDRAGGITGYSDKGYVYNSYNFGNVTGGKYGGGIVGLNSGSLAEAANCYNAGAVSATENGGGVADGVSYGRVLNCYYLSNGELAATGTITKNGSATDCTSFTASEGSYALADAVFGTNDLLTALNAWVTAKNDDNYSVWAADTGNSNYPVFAQKVVITKEDKTITYDGNTYDVSQLFGIDSNAGAATYALVSGGTGEGTLSGTTLTITKVGTFDIKVTTAASGIYLAGEQTATLTVLEKPKAEEPSTGRAPITASKRCTITFETNGGTKIQSLRVDKNTKLEALEIPEREGYTFDGWYTDKDLTAAYDFDAEITKSMTLYAKWVEDEAEDPGDNNEDNKGEAQEPADDDWENPFGDVSAEDWYFDCVKYVSKNGLMNGMGDTAFAPNGKITRGMFVTVLYRAEGEPAVNRSIPFADVSAADYFANAVIWAQQNGIVNGISETSFAPDASITREQIAAILYRYAVLKGYDVTAGGMKIREFADFESISDYALTAMTWAVNTGLMNGKTETTLNPKDNATRAEVAAMLQRFIGVNK